MVKPLDDSNIEPATLPMTEREQLPATAKLSEKSPRKKVEHTASGSYADTEDLLDPIRRQTYHPDLGVHGLKQHIDCEATDSADGHSGPATHFIRMPGERDDQREAVCAVHHARIVNKALELGHYDIDSDRIQPEEVAKHNALRGVQDREVRTHLEWALHHQGLAGQDALFGRVEEDLGKGGGSRTTPLQEVKQRRTPQQAEDTLQRALERARQQGGRVSSKAPTISVEGEDLTLGESNAYVAALRRQTEPEKYSLAGVLSPSGDVESIPTSTRKFEFNKAGVPNTRGGRKAVEVKYPYDTSNENLPGYTEEEMAANPDLRKSQEARLASGTPLEGIKPRGFSKKNNKAIKVTLTSMEKRAPETDIIGSFENKRMQKITDKRLAEADLNESAAKLRKIEAEKTRLAESRNAAFKIDWNQTPRPE